MLSYLRLLRAVCLVRWTVAFLSAPTESRVPRPLDRCFQTLERLFRDSSLHAQRVIADGTLALLHRAHACDADVSELCTHIEAMAHAAVRQSSSTGAIGTASRGTDAAAPSPFTQHRVECVSTAATGASVDA